MIDSSDKFSCCGCGACVQSCPQGCISLHEDREGFLYPAVLIDNCLECGSCEAVCPMLGERSGIKPEAVFAAKASSDSIRKNSSSGGVFYLLASSVIEKGGIVFGARFNESWEVEHGWADTIDGLRSFMGSKYVQSKIGNTYAEAESFLTKGRRVLFSGTPCQIAGLQSFLKKRYDGLLLVGIVCHGVPSPMVWRDYLSFICQKYSRESKREKRSENDENNRIPSIKSISFRDKTDGWKQYGFTMTLQKSDNHFGEMNRTSESKGRSIVIHENHRNNLFMRGFLSNLFLRPSCYQCKFKGGRCGADIILGDFWGVQSILPEVDDDKGVSLVLTNTENAINIIRRLGIQLHEVSYQVAFLKNPCLENSVRKPTDRDLFFEQYNKFGVTIIEKYLSNNKPTVLSKIKRRFRQVLAKVLNR